ncbi:MAG: NAD(P)/FAD-dependent oxidoreductase [Tatlockia sp.]|nr:NAD(P)/FAD-dependent oxidoreductase [Tatlockia sp.]
MKNCQRIVVVGGGAGGLELVASLGKKFGKTKKAEILLIDSSPIHLWKPLLHEFAAGTLYSYDDELSYLAYSATHHFQFCLGSMEGLNRKKKEIILSAVYDEDNEAIPPRIISYDLLIIAVGSISNGFNIPGVKEFCYTIDNSEQALNFQKHTMKTMMMEFPSHSKNDKHELNIAVVGGGATGVELCAELKYAIEQLTVYGFDFDPKKISVSLIESSNKLLPALPVTLSSSVLELLKKLGVRLYISEQVCEVTPEGIHTKNGAFIPSTVKVWAAGIKAPAFLRNLDGLEVNKINQLIVKPTLQTTLDNSIFALGDCADCPQEDSEFSVPPRAQAAHQQASFLVKNIVHFLNDKPLLNFRYHDHGSLISVSRYETVGNLIKGYLIQGKLARFAYRSLYRQHQIALFGYWRVALLMLSNWLCRKIRPRLKLH